MNKSKITILGDGAWGSTLANILSKKGYPVTLWGAFSEYSSFMEKERVNPKFLPGIKFGKEITFTSDLSNALLDKNLIVLAVPSQYISGVLKKIKQIGFSKKSIFLSVVKGIEIQTLRRMSEVIKAELGSVKMAVLSGPTIASEVAASLPATAVIASRDKTISKYLQKIFNAQNFRLYTNSDIIGVELGGSLKNVIAIASGIADGLGFGANTKAAILSRGLAEIARLGKAMGADAKTFYGLSGLGDLVTTCVSRQSRNRFVGEELGKGRNLKKAMSLQAGVAEGVPTAKSAYALSLKHKVEMPITREVYKVLYENKSPQEAVKDLMTRRSKEE